MSKYLIDVNLPYRFALWTGEGFLLRIEINESATDDEIWRFARLSNLTIVTKDSDFSHRIMLSDPPPKVIHIRVGNMKIKEFFRTMSSIWSHVVLLSDNHKLVNVFNDRIEAIE